MTPAELENWRFAASLTAKQASAQLGCSTATWTSWTKGRTRIPRYIGLAISALNDGLPPWGEAIQPLFLAKRIRKPKRPTLPAGGD